jgi:hypothetical protein
MRSSFDLALTKLKENGTDASSLGLAIGFEFGPMNVTRLWNEGGTGALLSKPRRPNRRERAKALRWN